MKRFRHGSGPGWVDMQNRIAICQSVLVPTRLQPKPDLLEESTYGKEAVKYFEWLEKELRKRPRKHGILRDFCFFFEAGRIWLLPNCSWDKSDEYQQCVHFQSLLPCFSPQRRWFSETSYVVFKAQSLCSCKCQRLLFQQGLVPHSLVVGIWVAIANRRRPGAILAAYGGGPRGFATIMREATKSVDRWGAFEVTSTGIWSLW